jgi:tripartite-type tricarboxylate transporter receptor subunit TctC
MLQQTGTRCCWSRSRMRCIRLFTNSPTIPRASFLGRGGYVLGMTPSLPANNVKELIAIAKAKPGQLFMGNSGAGSFVHLASVLFSQMAGADIVHVAYKGSGPALVDILGGHAHLVIGAPGQLAGHIKAGKIKALGVTDIRRSPALPDVPAVAESGLPGYEAANWWGLAATGGTPRPVIDKLHAAIVAVLASGKARAQFEAEGAVITPLGPDELTKFIATETEKWGKIVKEAGIKAE